MYKKILKQSLFMGIINLTFHINTSNNTFYWENNINLYMILKYSYMKIVFATNNQHKLEEIKDIFPNNFEIVSLKDIGCNEEIPEDYETLEENALQKALFIKNKYGYDCFADDTGLEVDALDGKPGVYSARYAGENRSAEDNMKKVLMEMELENERSARFKTVIALSMSGKEYLFEGSVEGKILEEKRGEKGFGYDPIFQPRNYDKSFAEMTNEEKNKISHRGRAVKKLIDFFKSLS